MYFTVFDINNGNNGLKIEPYFNVGYIKFDSYIF